MKKNKNFTNPARYVKHLSTHLEVHYKSLQIEVNEKERI